MKNENSNLTVLGVCAHPDDLDASAGGSFAKWAKEGAKCYYLICTDGRMGSIDQKITQKKLIETRKKEEIAAGKILGLKGVYFLNHIDTELEVNKKLKGEIVRYIRKLRPDIVVTTDPSSVYSKRGFVNHSDHRAAGMATIDAVYPLAKNRFAFKELEKEGLKPHKVKYLYIVSWGEGTEVVDITKTVDLKVKALQQHKTQGLSQNADRIKQMGRMIGKAAGYKYAESFIKIEFR